MKKSIKVLISSVLIVAVLFGATGCTTFNNFKESFFPTENVATEQTIKLGIYESLTGDHSELGKAELQGIELANELYPEVLGKKVELVSVDNQSNMYVGETAIQELISYQPSLIFGSCGEVLTLVAGDYIKAASIPAITISSTNPLITTNNDFYFSMTFAEEKQGNALAEYICEKVKKATAVTVKFENDDASTGTLKRFRNKMKSLTENEDCIKGRYSVEAGTTDFGDTIEKIIEDNPKVVYLSMQPSSAKAFMEQATKAGLTDVIYLGDRSWNDESFLKFVAKNNYEIVYPSDFSQDVTTDTTEIFTEAYAKKYGTDAVPSEATALAFDAYLVALQAIEDAQETAEKTTEKDLAKKYETDAAYMAAVEELNEAKESGIPSGKMIRDALLEIKNFEGAAGVLSYNGKSEARKSITVNYISEGQLADTYVYEQ